MTKRVGTPRFQWLTATYEDACVTTNYPAPLDAKDPLTDADPGIHFIATPPWKQRILKLVTG